MGQPTGANLQYPLCKERRRTGGTETSKYPEEKKAKCDSPSSGERTGNSPNSEGVKAPGRCPLGVVGHKGAKPGLGRRVTKKALSRRGLECLAKEGDSPVGEKGPFSLPYVPKYHGPRGIPWESGRTTS